MEEAKLVLDTIVVEVSTQEEVLLEVVEELTKQQLIWTVVEVYRVLSLPGSLEPGHYWLRQQS